MKLAAYLHGAPGRLPFIGHFRLGRQEGPLSIAMAGCVAQRSDLSSAFRAAREVEAVLRNVSLTSAVDRHDLLTITWEALCEIEASDLGPQGGADLTVLLSAADQQGMGIAGMGLGGVWSWTEDALQPLVTGDHPLLCGPGRPDRLPGVLTLDAPAPVVVAVPHDHPVPTLPLTELAKNCGVHP